MSKTREMIIALNEQFEKRTALLEANQLLIDGLAADLKEIEFTKFALGDTGFELDLCFCGKRAELTQVFKAIRQRGYVPTIRPSTKLEASYATWWNRSIHCDHHREFDYDCIKCSNALEGDRVKGTLSIWMHFTSKECKAVKVGTKMVEQTIYEVQCDSELAELGI